MEYLEVFDVQLPKIGLGTWQMRGDSCRRSVLSALEMGYRHIDTAEFYRNEEAVGQGIRGSGLDREELFVTSKVWSTHFRRDQVRKACEDSLRRLGLDYLDLYLIHHPSDSVPVEETLAGMQDLVESGKTRWIGVSNFSIDLLERSRELVEVPIFTNQVKYHPFHRRDNLQAYCQREGLVLTAYSPLAQGGVLGNSTLETIGKKYGKSAAQVALRWAVEQGNVIVIPKASSREHQENNLAVFDFELTRDDRKRIRQLG